MPINRREFLTAAGAAGITLPGLAAGSALQVSSSHDERPKADEFHAEVAIIGGSLGGCGAALAALRNGLRVRNNFV